MRIGFLLLGTNKYLDLATRCANSLKEFVHIEDSTIDTLLFTNNSIGHDVFAHNFHITHLPWPLITLMRYNYFQMASAILEKYDYLYYIDADMQAVSPIGNEILGDRVATKHPGLWGRPSNQLPFERNSKSSAYIPIDSPYDRYYFGALQGGTSVEFLKMCRILKERTENDLKQNYIPIWHDESMMNKYFKENPPTVELGNEYAYVEKWQPNVQPKIVCLEKDHDLIRNESIQ